MGSYELLVNNEDHQMNEKLMIKKKNFIFFKWNFIETLKKIPFSVADNNKNKVFTEPAHRANSVI